MADVYSEYMPPPTWLIDLAWASLSLGFLCSVIIITDEIRHPQHMWIMNVVWPVTALYASVLALAMYCRFGRPATKHEVIQATAPTGEPPNKKKAAPVIYSLAAMHCGAGCALGDIIAEWSIFFFPIILKALGYESLWNHKIFSAWVLDYILAYSLGIAFQYFTIAPMRNLSPGKGIMQAVKADTLSLTAWQMGMYGWMAIATFLIFGYELAKNSPVFWLMMQIAMLCGFATAYPVNVWLVRVGIKERMA